MNIHPHVHVLLMGGYLTRKNEWIPLSESKVFPNEAMSCRFKTVLLKSLRKYFQENIPSDIWNKKWIVYTKRADTGDSHVIEYLGSYVKRIAIASSRILEVGTTHVTFKYRHRVDRGTIEMKEMTLPGLEFLRRYMQHVLPNRFVRVRYYGLMHPAYAEPIAQIKRTNGEVRPTDRHSPQATPSSRECITCKKPFRITMVIFPFYLANRINTNGKSGGKLYTSENITRRPTSQ